MDEFAMQGEAKNMGDDDVVSLAQASRIARVGKRILRRALASGELRGRNIRGRIGWVLRVPDLLAWVSGEAANAAKALAETQTDERLRTGEIDPIDRSIKKAYSPPSLPGPLSPASQGIISDLPSVSQSLLPPPRTNQKKAPRRQASHASLAELLASRAPEGRTYRERWEAMFAGALTSPHAPTLDEELERAWDHIARKKATSMPLYCQAWLRKSSAQWSSRYTYQRPSPSEVAPRDERAMARTRSLNEAARVRLEKIREDDAPMPLGALVDEWRRQQQGGQK